MAVSDCLEWASQNFKKKKKKERERERGVTERLHTQVLAGNAAVHVQNVIAGGFKVRRSIKRLFATWRNINEFKP